MKNMKFISIVTVFLFLFTLFAGSYSTLFSQTAADDEIAALLEKADEHYRNGDFKKAIAIYQGVIDRLEQKKELVKTKKKLFEIMISLAFTHFTIQENEKAEAQLEKVIRSNPNQELDEEFYPPKFIDIFKNLQKGLLGSLHVTSMPAGAIVFLNGARMGKTPLDLEKYLAGEYELKAELEGYEAVQKIITVSANRENREDIALDKIKKKKIEKEEPKVVAKEAEKPKKKKKKVSPLLLIGGAAVVAALVLILASGKKEKPPQLLSRLFNSLAPFPIAAAGGLGWIDVDGLPATARIERVQYRVAIEHPAMEKLSISLVGTDNRTSFLIWHRKTSPEPTTIIEGETDAFNGIPANGRWKVLVTNNGTQKGQIVEWHIRIFYFEN